MRLLITALALCVALSAVAAGPASDSGKALGRATAPVTIDLYSDFQCPHCKELHDEILPLLLNDYVNTGKVYLVRHYFVLRFPYSRLSASYVCAAGRVGKFNQASDVLFRTQQVWGQTGKVDETVSSVLSPAEAEKVRKMAKDPSVAAEIDEDTALGTREGVTQTPTMIIVHNGKKTPISGNVSYSLLKMYIDKLLAQ
jgi:protein-disulfide isomerase